MLTGSIKFLYGARNFKYDVCATDTSEIFSMYMTSGNYDAITFMDNIQMEDTSDLMWERRVDITLAKVNVATPNSLVNGKKVKRPVNADFFCRLGTLIRYAKNNCITKNEEGYTGLV